jgi:hypothetical protein
VAERLVAEVAEAEAVGLVQILRVLLGRQYGGLLALQVLVHHPRSPALVPLQVPPAATLG